MAVRSLGAARSVAIALLLQADNFQAGLRSAGGSLNTFATSGDAKLNGLRQSAAVAGAAMVAGFGVAVGAAMEFDSAMSEVAATTGATGGALDALREQALAAGAATVYSATEAAQAQAELAKAGVSTADILAGALAGTLDLAAATGVDVPRAATIASNALNTFNLAGSETSHVADVLAAGSNKSATSADELAMAMSQAGLVAAQTGLSFEETTGVLSMFSNAGLRSSDAGTSLKTMLLRLNPSTKEAATAMRDLGLNFYDARGEFIGIDAAAELLHDRLGELTDQQRQQALQTIFGQDAIRAATLMYQAGGDGVQEWTGKVDDAGYASELAATKLDNLKGDLEALGGSIETVLITGGSGATTALRELTQAATGVVNGFGLLPPVMQGTLFSVVGVTGGVLALVSGFGMMVGPIQTAKAAMVGMGGAAEVLAAKMTMANFAAMAGGAAIAIPVFGAIAIGLSNAAAAADEYAANQAKLRDTSSIEAQANYINHLVMQMEGFQATIRAAGTSSNETQEFFERINPWGHDKLVEAEDNSRKLEQMIKSETALLEAKRRAYSELSTEMGLTEKEIDDLAGAAGLDLTAALEEAKLSGAGFAGGAIEMWRTTNEFKGAIEATRAEVSTGVPVLDDAADSMEGMADETKNAAEQLDDYLTLVDSLLGLAFSEDEALDSLMGSMADLRTKTEELRAGVGGWLPDAFDRNSEAGRAWREQVRGIVTDDMPQLIEAWGNAGITGDEFRAKLNQQVDDLIANAVAFGVPRAKAEEYFGVLRLMPEYVPTDVEVRGVPEGLSAIGRVEYALAALPAQRIVDVFVNIVGAKNSLGIDAFGFADGGLIDRPMVALRGEAGPELELPLSKPGRSRQLLEQHAPWLMGGSGAGGGGGGGSVSTVNNITVTLHAPGFLGDANDLTRVVTSDGVAEAIGRKLGRLDAASSGGRVR